MNNISSQNSMAGMAKPRVTGRNTVAEVQRSGRALASGRKETDAERIEKLNEFIFGSFFKMLMKEMRKGVKADALMGGGFAEGVFTEFYDDLIAKEFAKQCPSGLAKNIIGKGTRINPQVATVGSGATGAKAYQLMNRLKPVENNFLMTGESKELKELEMKSRGIKLDLEPKGFPVQDMFNSTPLRPFRETYKF